MNGSGNDSISGKQAYRRINRDYNGGVNIGFPRASALAYRRVSPVYRGIGTADICKLKNKKKEKSVECGLA